MAAEPLRAIERIMLILNCLSETPRNPKRLPEIAAATGIHRASTHRLLAQLSYEGLIEATGEGYSLGPACWRLGRAAAQRFDLADISRPSAQRIAERTEDVCLFSVRMGTHVEVVVREEGAFPVHPTSLREGSVRPLGVGAHALAVLSSLSDDDVNQALDATRSERAARYPAIHDAYVREKIGETRTSGYAFAPGEIVYGQAAMSVACMDVDGSPIGALTFSAVADRLGPKRHQDIADLLFAEVREIEARFLGAAYPPERPGETFEPLKP